MKSYRSSDNRNNTDTFINIMSLTIYTLRALRLRSIEYQIAIKQSLKAYEIMKNDSDELLIKVLRFVKITKQSVYASLQEGKLSLITIPDLLEEKCVLHTEYILGEKPC